MAVRVHLALERQACPHTPAVVAGSTPNKLYTSSNTLLLPSPKVRLAKTVVERVVYPSCTRACEYASESADMLGYNKMPAMKALVTDYATMQIKYIPYDSRHKFRYLALHVL